MRPAELTIRRAQRKQPWTVPYSKDFDAAASHYLFHLHGTHAVLHASKSVGKLAAVFETLDHSVSNVFSASVLSDAQRKVVKAMSADLMTVALRLANLYKFDLAAELIARVQEKNGVSL